ncbi:hypothetical protein LEN26_007313 [Aphanomyces euteiches]|nr:hypothetical protein LEN26_007313 [Aphanomyces euteiches]KAH9196365.1 hypothetical protein AeNC1_001660 [Aphanomyces euteiches]
MPTAPSIDLESVSSQERKHYARGFEFEPAMEAQTLQVKPVSNSVIARNTPSSLPSATGATSSLVAKIRKQAKELSELHEELAAKDKLIHKLENSRLHGTLPSKPSEVEEWKAKCQKEQKKNELCAKKLRDMKRALDDKEEEKKRLVQHSKQFELALADMRAARKESGTKTATDEERIYIRILEEAVQLKAEEFNVGGQAELMIVLAELRQTIQAQQDKLSEKDAKILQLQLATATKAEKKSDTDAEDTTTLSSLSKQKDAIIDYAQSLAEKHRVADTQNSELLDQIASLKDQHKHAEEELKTLAERYAKLEIALESTTTERDTALQRISDLQTQMRDKESQISSLHEDCATKARHVNDMKALQDDLLNGISEAKESELRWKKKADDAHTEVAAVKTKLSEVQTELATFKNKQTEIANDSSKWRAQVDSLKRALQRLQQEKELVDAECKQMLEYEKTFTDVSSHRKSFAALVEAERALRSDLAVIDSFATSTHAHLNRREHHGAQSQEATFVEGFIVGDAVARVALLDQRRMPPQLTLRLPRFAAFLHQVFESVTTLVQHVSHVDTSWKRERFNLVAARDAFETSGQLIQKELEMMRQWSFQLHDELQQAHRSLVEMEQKWRTADVLARDATDQAKDLQEQLMSSSRALQAAETNLERLHADMAHKDDDNQTLHIQLEELSGHADHLEQLQQEAMQRETKAVAALEATQTELEENQAAYHTLERQLHDEMEALQQLRLRCEAQEALATDYAALKEQADEMQKALAATKEEKRRQLDAVQAHSAQLQEAVWAAHASLCRLLPPPAQTKPRDTTTALRQFPEMVERLVQHQVKTHTHESMKAALLKNCQSVDYQDPSLCLLRELKLDLQQLKDENQALKAQLSGCRVGFMNQICTPEPTQQDKSPYRPIQPRNDQVVEGLRQKLMLKKPFPQASQAEAAPKQRHVSPEEYVKNARASSLEDQLDKLHAAFASFRTDV